MMPDSSLVFASVTELSKLLRKRKVSSVELTRLFLKRLESLGPTYNALAELTPELALTQARKADRALSKGTASSPLTGIPYGAKDLLATNGIPTRWGAPPYKDQVLDYDATVITKMREAGAVLAAKLAMVELAGGGGYAHASASLHGPGLNPWNLKHWAGGSSSGSGSAVAAGLVPFALGSETWGSIVTPSAYCGITGLRPTWGYVSRYGAMELAWSMDKVGPMAHSAEDCGWVLQAIAGFDMNDDTTIEDGFKFKPRLSRRDFQLGVLPLDYSQNPETEKAFEEAVRVLRRAGMKLTRTELPEKDYEVFTRTLLNGEMAAAHKALIESGRVDELVDAGAGLEGQPEDPGGGLRAGAAVADRRFARPAADVPEVRRADRAHAADRSADDRHQPAVSIQKARRVQRARRNRRGAMPDGADGLRTAGPAAGPVHHRRPVRRADHPRDWDGFPARNRLAPHASGRSQTLRPDVLRAGQRRARGWRHPRQRRGAGRAGRPDVAGPVIDDGVHLHY